MRSVQRFPRRGLSFVLLVAALGWVATGTADDPFPTSEKKHTHVSLTACQDIGNCVNQTCTTRPVNGSDDFWYTCTINGQNIIYNYLKQKQVRHTGICVNAGTGGCIWYEVVYCAQFEIDETNVVICTNPKCTYWIWYDDEDWHCEV